MEARSTRLLKKLKAYTDEMYNNYIDPSHIAEPDNSLLENVAATAGGDIASDCLRILNLLKDLETAAKTCKHIREQFQRENLDESDNVSADEDKTVESFQETPLHFEGPVEANASTGEDKTDEPFQENSLDSERPVEVNVNIEGETAKFCQENLELSESPVETSKERKTFHVLMDVSNFMAKELSVKILGKYLVVHGEHEALFDEHGKVSRKFTRKFEIPEEVDIETFRALYDCYRVLTIEASLKSIEDKEGTFDVPIYEETGSQQLLSTFKSLGPEFEELAKPHIKDGEFMRDFARNLAEQRPSDYIPMEKVI